MPQQSKKHNIHWKVRKTGVRPGADRGRSKYCASVKEENGSTCFGNCLGKIVSTLWNAIIHSKTLQAMVVLLLFFKSIGKASAEQVIEVTLSAESMAALVNVLMVQLKPVIQEQLTEMHGPAWKGSVRLDKSSLLLLVRYRSWNCVLGSGQSA